MGPRSWSVKDGPKKFSTREEWLIS